MGEPLLAPVEQLDQQFEQQRRYDLRTQFAELVNGNMRTDFELRLEGHDLVGEDGRSMLEVNEKGRQDAKEAVRENPQLWFEIGRRDHDEDEVHELIGMAAGYGPNTKVVVSDFPDALMDTEKDVGGYSVTRKQTMLRVYIRKEDGVLQMFSQSLDGSNRQGLEAIYSRFDKVPEEGELLGQRIDKELSEDEQVNLVDELTGIYDRELSAQFGGEFYAGRRPADLRNTYDFVCAQEDLIEECIRLEKNGWLTDKFMYDTAALMNKRFKLLKTEQAIPVIKTAVAYNEAEIAMLHQQLRVSGVEARQRGESFSACGVTLNGNGLDGSLESLMKLAGFGNKSLDEEDTEESGSCEFISKECPECHEPNILTKVKALPSGKKIISGSCGCAVIK